MDVVEWLLFSLRSLLGIFPIEVAATLGLVFFGLSWIRRRPIVTLPTGRCLKSLVLVGTGGALVVLVIASLTSWLPTLDPDTNAGGWWQRAVPLFTVILVFVAATPRLMREPAITAGERTITPRRHWWSYAPAALLWATGVLVLLLLLTLVWQIAIGVPLPDGADRYGIGPSTHGAPVYMEIHQGFGYVWGAGWPNHLATLIALILSFLALVLTLNIDANQSVFARTSAIELRQSQLATARILTTILLGGVLLALGAVWAFVGFNGDRAIGVGIPEDDGTLTFNLGTGYQDFAGVMHWDGYVIQGLGAAVLLRLAVDVWREYRSKRASLTDLEAVTIDSTETGTSQ